MSYEIIGARGKFQDIDKILSRTKELEQEFEVNIQLMDALMIYGKGHLISAVSHAERAFETGTNTANSMGMEIMLYASGERQISLAISKMGIKAGTDRFALIIYISMQASQHDLSKVTSRIMDDLSLTRDDEILKGNISVLLEFGISQDELETVSEKHWESLILERIALVDILK